MQWHYRAVQMRLGKTVADIMWETLRVELRAIRRSGAKWEHPEQDWVFVQVISY